MNRRTFAFGGKRLLTVIAIWCGLATMAMAGVGPHVVLSNPNVSDGRLTQVDYGDGETVYDATYDCRRTNPPSGDYHMYFQLDDNYINNGNYPIAHISVLIHDFGTGPITLQYESSSSTFQAITKYRTNTGGLKWFTFDVDNAKFANGQQGQFDFRLNDGGSSALYVKSVYVWCKKESAGTVSIDGGKFMVGGERFVMVGANYIAPWQTEWANWYQMWDTGYDSTAVERDMTQMEKAGANTIRTFLDFSDYICPSEGMLNSTVIQHVQDFCQRAENHGIKIIFSVGSAPSWLVDNIARDYGWIQWGDWWTNFELRKEKADFLVQLVNTADLGQYDSFMGFDLMNEPTFAHWSGTAQNFYDSLTPAGGSNATHRAWNRWVNAKYASLTNAYAAWGYQGAADTGTAVYPEPESHFTSSGSWDKKIDDYYAFVADSFVETTAYIRDRVRAEALERTLITIDFVIRGASDSLTNDIQTVRLLTTDYKRLGAACDFINLHIYSGFSSQDSWYRDRLVDLLALGTNKPVVLSEFGLPSDTADSQELENQRITWKGFMGLASTARIDGCLGWMWIDSSDSSVRDSDFGILTVSNTAKPAYNEFLQYKAPILISNEPVPDCVIDVDVDGYISPLEVFYQEGRTLVRNLIDSGHYPDMIAGEREAPLIDTIYNLPAQAGDPITGSLGVGGSYGAIILEDTIPDFMVGAMSYNCEVTAMNVGTNTWTAAQDYRLGSSDTYFGPGRWYLDAGDSIATNDIKTFNLTLTPPNTAGTFTRPWRMLREQVTWFGENHSHDIKVINVPALGARISTHTIPSVVQASSNFQVSVTVRNEGSQTWTAANYYRLGAVNDSDPFAAGRHDLAGGDNIGPGQSKTFTFTMTAPSQRGVYQSDWKMVQDGVAWFGQMIDVEIMVD